MNSEVQACDLDFLALQNRAPNLNTMSSKDEPYACKAFACAIQACLLRNNYDAAKCIGEQNAFEKCCRAELGKGNEKAREACNFVWKKWEREAKEKGSPK